MSRTTTDDPRVAGAGVGPDGAGLVVVTRDVHARRAWLLLAVGVFQVWLWTTRLVNLVNDPEPRTTGFVVVHAVLYVAAFGAAGLLLALGWRMRRETRRTASTAGGTRRTSRERTAP